MSDHRYDRRDSKDLAFAFAKQLRDVNFRLFLALSGYIPGVTVQLVSERTVVDVDVLREQGAQIIREAPDSEFGWVVVPEKPPSAPPARG